TGMAFVVIQHLSADFTSMMTQILSRLTRMPIKSVTDAVDIERDTVYLLVPGKEMIVTNRRLLATDRTGGLNLSVDVFFRSLAEDLGGRAVAVVLSGTGSDGAAGLVEVHRGGGLTVAQTLRSAEFDGMPKSAVATGKVDMVLDPEHIPAALTGHAKRLKLKIAASDLPEIQPSVFDTVFEQLQMRFAVNFAHYKPNTIIRRVERRMALRQSSSLTEYTKLLASDPDELETLYHDLLIGVTRFFRDEDTWQYLEREVLPPLMSSEQGEVRVWTAGCATGEEAYTLAILLHEAASKMDSPPDIKIFATDVHQRSLDRASFGVYPARTLDGLSPERVESCFTRQAEDYVIAPHLRRMVVFARQDVTIDPPFTKLDLVVCRNLLIYLTVDAQRKALSLFHFSLKRDGVMLLGSSEGLAELVDDFNVIDARRNVFRKASDRHLVSRFRLPSAQPMLRDTNLAPVGLPAASRTTGGRPVNLVRAYDALMDAYVPPGLLVTLSGEVAHTFGDASRFMRPPSGAVTLYASELVLPELRLPLISALARMQKTEEMVRYAGIRVDLPNDGPTVVRLTVRPMKQVRASEYALITFERPEAPAEAQLGDEDQADEMVLTPSSLQDELQNTREQLQATVEELETSNEELQATNEELIASNEELQSTNEELHSVNEELSTLNQEHEGKIIELERVTEESDNLLRSIDISSVFVDSKLRIRKFSPHAAQQFGLMRHDINRQITHFRSLLADDQVLRDLAAVSATGERVERELRDATGRYFLMRVSPYLKTNGEQDGAVLSFVDVEQIKRGSLRLSRAFTELQVFTYAVSHDLVGPSNRASEFIRLAVERADEAGCDEQIRECLEQTDQQVRLVSAQVQDLLMLSRVETEGEALAPVSLSETARQALRDLERRVLERGAQVRVAEMPMVLADAKQLRLVFYHL
ncbi:MAG: CheR family methyltransferase, partial [Pseudomonadota bacterium]